MSAVPRQFREESPLDPRRCGLAVLYFPFRRSLHFWQPYEGTRKKGAATNPEEGRAQVTNLNLLTFSRGIVLPKASIVCSPLRAHETGAGQPLQRKVKMQFQPARSSFASAFLCYLWFDSSCRLHNSRLEEG